MAINPLNTFLSHRRVTVPNLVDLLYTSKFRTSLTVSRFHIWQQIEDCNSLVTARSSPIQDYHRSVSAAIWKPLPDWSRPVGRPRHTCLCALESDLRSLNVGLSLAWRKAANGDAWWSAVDTAMLKTSLPWKKRKNVLTFSFLLTSFTRTYSFTFQAFAVLYLSKVFSLSCYGQIWENSYQSLENFSGYISFHFYTSLCPVLAPGL